MRPPPGRTPRSSLLARTILLEPLSGLLRTAPESSIPRPLESRIRMRLELLAHTTSGEHECTSPERRALVALATGTVKHISYRRRGCCPTQIAGRKDDILFRRIPQKPRMSSPDGPIRSAAAIGHGTPTNPARADVLDGRRGGQPSICSVRGQGQSGHSGALARLRFWARPLPAGRGGCFRLRGARGQVIHRSLQVLAREWQAVERLLLLGHRGAQLAA